MAQNPLPPLPQPGTALLSAPSQASLRPTSVQLGDKGHGAGAAAPTQPGSISLPYAQWMAKADDMLRSGNFPSTLTSGGNAVLTVIGGQTLTGGFTETPFDFGSVTSGTITPNPSKCLKQKVTNNGAFAIAATAEIGDVELLITNGASAGAISFSGFTKQFTGDALDTTNGHKFVVFIYAFDAGVTACVVKALQ